MKLLRARVPNALRPEGGEGFSDVDVELAGERIASVTPCGATAEPGDLDCAGRILVPAFVDMHTHLDKGHIAPRTPSADGTFTGALAAVRADAVAHWTAEDVEARMEFSLRTAFAHGTRAIRTHIDSQDGQRAISWPVFQKVQARWAGRVALQAASLMGIDTFPDDPRALFDEVTRFGGLVGAVLYPVPELQTRVAALLQEAERRGMDVDFHVDERLDPSSNCLRTVAAETARIGFSGTITCGHCCSLMVMAEKDALKTLDAVARENIAVVSLPLCNLYLMDRDPHARRTPRIRGGTLVHEMAARGIPVAFASDNTRDPFYAYGDLDMLEVWREATRILHLDHPFGTWSAAFSRTPAKILKVAPALIGEGAPADLVLFEARRYDELLSRPQMDRTVFRAGAVLDAVPPQYEELRASTP